MGHRRRGEWDMIVLHNTKLYNFMQIKMSVLKFSQFGERVSLFSNLPNSGHIFNFTFKVSFGAGNRRLGEICIFF